MTRDEFPRFAQMVQAVHEMRQLTAPSATSLQLSFRALARYPMAHIEAGFELMLADPGETYRVPVQPAHIIAAMERHVAETDGRPSAAEAWGMALDALDEAATVRVTSEVLEAMSACRQLQDPKERFSARQAFSTAYERIVAEARRQLRPVSWTVSLGTHAVRRHERLESYRAAGLLPSAHAQLLLGAPEQLPEVPADVVRANLAKLRQLAATIGGGRARRTGAAMAANQAERERIQSAKAGIAPAPPLMPLADLANPPGLAVEPPKKRK